MNKLALSPDREYVLVISESKTQSLVAVTKYGGEDSKSVPCGFITDIMVRKNLSKRQNKNARYRSNKKAKALANCGSLGVLKPQS